MISIIYLTLRKCERIGRALGVRGNGLSAIVGRPCTITRRPVSPVNEARETLAAPI
jgi:hypothetical protein